MPADQEFLVSYGVKIDEAGVSRLQQILEQDRVLADRISGAFSGADESMQAFFRRAAEARAPAGEDSLLSRLAKQYYGLSRLNRKGDGLDSGSGYRAPGVRGQVQDLFSGALTEPIPLDLNTSAAESAARSAAEAIRSLFSSPVYLNVQPGSPGSGGPGSTFLRMSSGGRFTKPTQVQVAEDGDAEYIIPVKKEGKAVPLLRQLLGELSPAARESLGGETLTLQNADLAGMRAGSPAAAVTQNNQNISAPVNIHVNAHGADGKEIGETIYDTAERYLLRTLRGAGN